MIINWAASNLRAAFLNNARSLSEVRADNAKLREQAEVRVQAAYDKGFSDGFNWLCLRIPKGTPE